MSNGKKWKQSEKQKPYPNLQPYNKNLRDPEYAKKIGRKGGIASAKAKREKANLKRTLEEILKLDVPNEKLKENMEALGLDPNMEQALVLSLVQRAISTGSEKSFREIRDTLGQTTTLKDRQEQSARIDKLKAEKERIDADTESKNKETQTAAANLVISDAIWKSLMNPAYAEFLTDDRPTQIFYGGSSSGKSFGILGQRTARDVMTGKRNYLVVRKTARTLRNSSFNEIKKCIYRMDLEDEFKINQTDMAITHKATGAQILFSGLDDVEKVKSITPQQGVLTDVIIEEATEASYDDFKNLQKRLRGGDESIIKRVTMLFNPILQDHWIYTEFFAGKWDDSKNYYGDENLLIRKTTYKDNKWLTEDDINKLENETDKYYYDVYTLGNWGVLGNLIFTNWETRDLSELERTWSKFHNGLDFGFFPDPTAFIRVGFSRAKKEVYVFRTDGGQNLTNDNIALLIKPYVNREIVTCDNAEPKSIQELNNFGISAVPAVKGPGSVEFGIKWLQKMKIIVDPKCQELISELRKYKYQEDKNGNVLPKPVNRDDHWIDALRYALEATMVEVKVN